MNNSREIDGVLLIDKAPGMTSHDVVAIARRSLGTKKIGHCGTLDPLATGLLIIVLGRGTKIQDLLMSEDKEYVGTMRLGVMTDSQDADGKITETREVPEFSREQIDGAFGKFQGDFYQMPPMVSAIKQAGIPLYKLARQGKTVEREFVERHAALLDRGNHRRHLVKIAVVFSERGVDLIAGKVGDFAGFGDLPIGILAVRHHTEPHRADVFLVLAHQQILNLRAAPEHDDEEPGGERVEGAAMADLLRAERAPHDGDDVVRGHARGFIYEEDAVRLW